MKIRKTLPRLIVTVAVSAMTPLAGQAYVDVELDSGRHVIGQYYTDQGGKLTVFRPSGAIELDRASVRSIQEPPGDMPSETGTASGAASADAEEAAAAKSQTVATTHPLDPTAREHEISRKLINVRLDRLAATQRGDDEAVKKLDKQIKSLQGERSSNWKKLHPDDGKETSD